MSYYRTGGNGKNSAIFPGPMTLFWWWTRKIRWGDFEFVKGDGSVGKGRGIGLEWPWKLVGKLMGVSVLTLLLVMVRYGKKDIVGVTAMTGMLRGANESLRVLVDKWTRH